MHADQYEYKCNNVSSKSYNAAVVLQSVLSAFSLHNRCRVRTFCYGPAEMKSDLIFVVLNAAFVMSRYV